MSQFQKVCDVLSTGSTTMLRSLVRPPSIHTFKRIGLRPLNTNCNEVDIADVFLLIARLLEADFNRWIVFIQRLTVLSVRAAIHWIVQEIDRRLPLGATSGEISDVGTASLISTTV